jgi:ribosomal-protein-serine acetyltransferase
VFIARAAMVPGTVGVVVNLPGNGAAGGSRAVRLPRSLRRGPLLLRLWEPQDVPAMAAAIAANAEWLSRFMPWVREEPLPVVRRLALIERWRLDFDRGRDATYGIWLDGAVAGGCGLHQRIGPGGLEIGYWVDHRVLRRRVAATTAALLTEAALAAPGADRVEIHHAVENTASSGVPALLGYRAVGESQTEAVPWLSGRQAVWRLTRDDADLALQQRLRGIAVRPAPTDHQPTA